MSAASPLEAEIRRLIAATGALPVSQYVSLCLTHPEHGYYVTRDPFGASGDFVTAPEISQMFGELIGLWAAAAWKALGAPENVRLVELGPGRGTLMRDALRATHVMPQFRNAIVVHLVEASPTLEAIQRETLSAAGVFVHWHRELSEVPSGPLIAVANEFFDALPVHQMVRQSDGWHERTVGLDASGNFAFGVAPAATPQFDRVLPRTLREAPAGSIFEWRADTLVLDLARRVREGGAALIVDYGHYPSGIGDTLQAMRGHSFADPLAAPGSADITAHVDFDALARAAESIGTAVHGPVTQRDFLLHLGIEARAQALKAAASGERRAEIDAALARLTQTGRTGMGELFKVIALSDPSAGPLPAFEA